MVTDTPLLTVMVPLTAALTVCVGASQMSPPVAATCVVVVGMALPPLTETVPEMTTVLETETVPDTAAETVCVGANQTTAPVTAACVVVATAVDAPIETDSVCVGASHTT